ncbi:hypothetical protein V5799_009398, partial [Amblyomma americanum]
ASTWFSYWSADDTRVLFADESCILMGQYIVTGGRTFCMLWIKEYNLQNPPGHCNFMLVSFCGKPVYNAYQNEKTLCDIYEKMPDVWRH